MSNSVSIINVRAHYVVACLLTTLLLSGPLLAGQLQVTPVQQQTQPLQTKDRIAHLPSFQYTVPGTVGVGPMVPQPPITVTKTVDFTKMLARFAAAKNITLAEARLETLVFLGMMPRARTQRDKNDPRPTFELADVDHFEITANEQFFTNLPSMMYALELGKKQVIVHVKTFAVSPSQTTRINAFIDQGTARVNCAKLPPIIPVATKIESADAPFKQDSFISTTTIVRENLPVTTGRISKKNLAVMESYLNDSQTASILNAPSVYVLPGQVATISDLSYRPFVVGLDTVVGDNATATQPIVQSVEEGTTVRVMAIPRGDKVQLLSDIAISKLVDVKSFTFVGAENEREQSIQVPKQSVRQVNLSTILDDEGALFVDPNFVQEIETTDSRGRKVSSQFKIMFVLNAKIIDIDTPPNDRQAKQAEQPKR